MEDTKLLERLIKEKLELKNQLEEAKKEIKKLKDDIHWRTQTILNQREIINNAIERLGGYSRRRLKKTPNKKIPNKYFKYFPRRYHW